MSFLWTDSNYRLEDEDYWEEEDLEIVEDNEDEYEDHYIKFPVRMITPKPQIKSFRLNPKDFMI
jgi:hypothetical protein